MPSSKSKIRNLKRLPRPSRTAIGAAAASVAVAGVVTGTVLSTTTGPAHGSVEGLGGLAAASHSTAAGHGSGSSASTNSDSVSPLLEVGSAGTRAPAHHSPATADHAQHAVAASHEATRRPARADVDSKTTHAVASRASTGHRAGAAHKASTARRSSAPKAADRKAAQRPSRAASHRETARRNAPAKAVAHVRRHVDAARHQAPAAPAGPVQIYDSVTPSAIPSGHPVATYADGPYAVSPSQVAGRQVMWIDTNGSDPKANALDVEPGDATPAGAATWTQQKLSADPHATAIIYTMQSDWQATQSAISGLPQWMQHHVRWWIADPTGTPHVLPGANATQWYWGSGYDITNANPGFWPNGR